MKNHVFNSVIPVWSVWYCVVLYGGLQPYGVMFKCSLTHFYADYGICRWKTSVFLVCAIQNALLDTYFSSVLSSVCECDSERKKVLGNNVKLGSCTTLSSTVQVHDVPRN